MMGGVLTDAAVPPVATAVTMASVADAVVAAVPVDAATADLSASLPMPVVPVVAEAISVPVAASAAPQDMPATTASLTVSLPAGPAPVPDSTPVIVTGPAAPSTPPMPMAQVATCMVEIEAGGRRRHAAEREEDAPAGEDEAIVAETDPVVVADASAATPDPVLSVMPLPSAAVAAWRAVSQSDANESDAASAGGNIVSAAPSDLQHAMTAASVRPVVEAGSARGDVPRDVFLDAAGRPVGSVAQAGGEATMRVPADVMPDVVVASTVRTVAVAQPFSAQDGTPIEVPVNLPMVEQATERPVVSVAPVAVQASISIRADAVAPAATVRPATEIAMVVQPVAAVPAVVQTPTPPIAASAAQAMPPAMAMLQDISALLAEPVPVAQPVPAATAVQAALTVSQPVATVNVTPPSPVEPVTVQPKAAMPFVMAAAESVRPGRRREGVGETVESGRSSEGIVPVSESATAPPQTLLSMPMSGTASAPTAGSDSGPAAIPAEAALGFHVDAARHGQELDQVTRDIAATGQAGAPLSFKLDSHRLGAVAVELTQQVAGLHVRLESDDATTRTILADQQQQLVTDARVAGVRIAETSVEAPRRDDATSGQGGGMARHDSSSAQGQNAQSQSGQAGAQANGQRGQGQPSQTAPGWSRGTRDGSARAGQPAVTPRELYA